MDIPEKYRQADRCGFGDTPELGATLVDLIVSGAKTATCGALRDYDGRRHREKMPQKGKISLVTDHAGKPVCAIRTTGVEVMKFSQVPQDFALAEGEGEFDQWRTGHIRFFERNGGWSEDLELVCERFELVEVFER